jgi:hypothetical protein
MTLAVLEQDRAFLTVGKPYPSQSMLKELTGLGYLMLQNKLQFFTFQDFRN